MERNKEKELQFIVDLLGAWCDDWQEPYVSCSAQLGCWASGWTPTMTSDLEITSEVPCVRDDIENILDKNSYIYLMNRLSEWESDNV